MQIRDIHSRLWLPCVIFPATVATWVEYWRSVRASDDSPASWAWYGGFWSACLNFPAFVYSVPISAPFRLAGVRGFAFGRLWLGPQEILFFLMVIVFWYWMGKDIDRWLANRGVVRPDPGQRNLMLLLYGTGLCFWVLIFAGLVYDMAVGGYLSSWHYFSYFLDRSLGHCARILWSVSLAVLFARRFKRRLPLTA